MSRVYVPSAGPDSWRQFLAKPELHWRKGFSARTLAYAWEAANGLPPEIEALIEAAYGSVELLLALPEHKTALPGGRRESQSDVFALLRNPSGLVACTIEGKVDEPFGPTVAEWLKDSSAGKTQRLNYICDLLGLKSCPPDVHYQLLHRTASALIEADRFATRDAAMIVHSFSPEQRWFDAFQRFATLFGLEATVGETALTSLPNGRRLALGWACGQQSFRLT